MMRNVFRVALAAFVITMTVASCSIVDPTSPLGGSPKPGPFTTEGLIYTATKVVKNHYTLRVVTHYTNSTNAALYFVRCNLESRSPEYAVLQLHPTNKDGAAWNPLVACGGTFYTTAFPSGATRIDTLELQAPNAWDHYTEEPFGALEGTMRLAYPVQSCDQGPCPTPVPDSLIFSNTFLIRLPR